MLCIATNKYVANFEIRQYSNVCPEIHAWFLDVGKKLLIVSQINFIIKFRTTL